MKDETIVAMWVSTILAFLEGLAIIFGVDGAFFLPVVGAICGVAGYQFKSVRCEK